MSSCCSFLGLYVDQNDSFKRQLTATATILAILCLPTVSVNFLIWTTILVKRHLHKPSYVLIANLALTDWLAGCISFSGYVAVCIIQSIDNDPCFMWFFSCPIAYVLGIATFLIVSFQSVERFIAIFRPFKYHAKFTNSMDNLDYLLWRSNSLDDIP